MFLFKITSVVTYTVCGWQDILNSSSGGFFSVLVSLMQIVIKVLFDCCYWPRYNPLYVCGFWFFEETVLLFEGQKTLLTSTYTVSMYSSVDAQNSRASDESLLLCFEVQFPLNYSCQILFFEGVDRSTSLVPDLLN